MKPVQTKWLDEFGAVALEVGAFGAREAAKDAILSKLQLDLANAADEIAVIQKLSVSNGKKQQQIINTKVRDQLTEFDLDEQRDGFYMSAGDQAIMNRALATAAKLGDQLDAVDAAGEPLFTDADRTKEFYNPMKRLGLISETLIPNQFSETEELRKGAFDAYAERVKQDQKGLLSQLYSENGGMVMSFLSAGASMVGGVTAIEQGANVDASKIDPNSLKPNAAKYSDLSKGASTANTETIAGFVGQGLNLISMGTDAVEDLSGLGGGEEDGEPPKVPSSLAKSMVAAVAAAIGSGLGPGLGVAVSAACFKVADASAIKRLLVTDPLTVSVVGQVIDALAAACAKAFASCAPDDLQAEVKAAGLKMSATLKASVGEAALLGEITEQKFGAVVTRISAASVIAVGAAKVDHIDILPADGAGKILAKANEQIVTDLNDSLAADEQAARTEREELEAAKDANSKARWIEKKIASMKRDAELLKWAESTMGLGLSVATSIIGPLAIAGAALDLTKNLLRAANRTRDWANFCAAKQDMFRDASAFSAPVAQFVHNSKQQSLHYGVQAACDLIKLIGAIVETASTATGPGAAIGIAVGKVMQGGAAIAASAETVLYEIKLRYDLESAWKTYRAALMRPENRKLALVAMKSNPTLAKYAVAWGAVIKKDALVVNFVRSTGLDNPQTLEGSSDVGLVQEFLELRFADDQTVTGRSPITTDWEPSTIKLTVTCWLRTKLAGEKHAELQPTETRSVDGALSKYERLANEIDGYLGAPAVGIPDAARERVTAATQAVIDAFNGYHPKRKGGGFHGEMQDVTRRFLEPIRELDQGLRKLPSPPS
ncbi:MAG: hypothetical protein ACI8UD_000020 [Planctomycetota bacterium]|jgi:hypothetical protein